MISLACIGDIAVDLYVTIPKSYVGGISFNVAWNAREHGVDARVYSAIGTDNEGMAVRETLARTGFPTDSLLVREGATARQRIVITPEGERVFDGYRAGVLSTLSVRDLSGCGLDRCTAVHIPLSDGLEELFDSVAFDLHGVTKIADLSIDGPNQGGLEASAQRYARCFDLLFVGGRPEHRVVIEDLSRTYPDRVFVLTLGRDGVVAFQGGASFVEDARPVEQVVDTTGCGDGFQGAFIARWLADRSDIRSALVAGVMQGAKVASFLGATQCVIDHAHGWT
ncbi:MAG: hypothetical protein RL518_2407 [Pseudomonadota bacterium]|jgi:fructoselysine 6-kinase